MTSKETRQYAQHVQYLAALLDSAVDAFDQAQLEIERLRKKINELEKEKVAEH